MQTSTPIEYAFQLIQYGQVDGARQALAAILQTDPQDAGAWALSAWVAPDSERCVYALRQVMALSQDARLVDWASRKLVLMEHIGTLDEEGPPLPFIPAPDKPSSAAEPVEDGKKKPRGPGYGVRQIGGGVVIAGVLIVGVTVGVQAIVSQIATADMSVGPFGFVLIVIGLGMIGAGYILDRSK